MYIKNIKHLYELNKNLHVGEGKTVSQALKFLRFHFKRKETRDLLW